MTYRHVCGIDCAWGCIITPAATTPDTTPDVRRYRVERSIVSGRWVVLNRDGEVIDAADNWADAFAVASLIATVHKAQDDVAASLGRSHVDLVHELVDGLLAA
ncbi:hypothetical protein [Agromyces sp. CCNWLW203]|uniref:hypothetical protein n=1 Tax=Agromyces sp. CCNWLW203 TaxID=3112842 RepID=UPI002F960EDD